MVTIMAEQSIAAQLRNDSDDPYFMVAPENNGDDLKWLQRNWALREAAAIYIDRLTKERDAARLGRDILRQQLRDAGIEPLITE